MKQKNLKIKMRHLIYIYVRCQGYTAIHRRGAGDIWQGLWEPVLVNSEQRIVDSARLIAKDVRHVLTHQVLIADFYLWEPEERPTLSEDYIWIREEDIDNYGIPRLIDILLSRLPSAS